MLAVDVSASQDLLAPVEWYGRDGPIHTMRECRAITRSMGNSPSVNANASGPTLHLELRGCSPLIHSTAGIRPQCPQWSMAHWGRDKGG